MTIFVLLGIGFLFLCFTGILISLDNRRRKYKKKLLHIGWRILGIVFFVISVFYFTYFVKCISTFNGEEVGERKILLRSTMNLSDVTIPTGNATLDGNLEENLGLLLSHEPQNSNNFTIVYTDALLNKKELSNEDIHEITYSEKLSKKQIQIVEYFVICQDGKFTMPGVYYYVVLSKEFSEKNKE